MGIQTVSSEKILSAYSKIDNAAKDEQLKDIIKSAYAKDLAEKHNASIDYYTSARTIKKFKELEIKSPDTFSDLVKKLSENDSRGEKIRERTLSDKLPFQQEKERKLKEEKEKERDEKEYRKRLKKIKDSSKPKLKNTTKN